jgi:hypothetical protein
VNGVAAAEEGKKELTVISRTREKIYAHSGASGERERRD